MTEETYLVFKEYSTTAQSILIDYQFIEEGLRMYLAAAYKFILSSLDSKMPFKYSYKDIENDSLGSLISKFERLSDDAGLVKELKELVKFRNKIAHQAFLLTAEQQNDSAFLSAQTKELSKVKARTNVAVHKVLEESIRLGKLNKIGA
jgi:hypothetical protein